MDENHKLVTEWLDKYLLEKAVNFTDERYKPYTIMSMEILAEKPPDLELRKQTLISNLPFHEQTIGSDMTKVYRILIAFIDDLLD